MARVLVIDDDGVILDLLRTVLNDEGHTPLGFASVEDVPRDIHADLVITDLIPLKAYNGERARSWIEFLKARYPAAPLIVVTAHTAALKEADSLGADAVLGKPFDVEHLLSSVKSLLR